MSEHHEIAGPQEQQPPIDSPTTIQLHVPAENQGPGNRNAAELVVDGMDESAAEFESESVETAADMEAELATNVSGPEFVASLLKKQQDVIDQLGQLGDQIDAFIEEITESRRQAEQQELESEQRDDEIVVEAA